MQRGTWALGGLVAAAVALAACGDRGTELETRPSAAATPPPAATEILLEITVTDDTVRLPPGPDTEIWIRGSGSWFPDLRFGGDLKGFARFPVGEEHAFFIYPDGRDGREIRVPFQMTAGMISGSVRDRTHVEIYDDRVVVLGTAIPDFEQTFPRRGP